jgi:AcrR family transcriptional regulator
VVDVTIELLRKHGESGFRLDELQRLTGINKSSLYRLFGDRDGLLATAYTKVFTAYVMESIIGMEAVIKRASSPAELRAGLQAATAFVSSPQRFNQRLDRAAIIAGVRGRPEYRQILSKAQSELTNAIAQLIEEASQRGLVNLKHSPQVGAQFIQAVTLGRVIAEIEDIDDAVGREAWISLVNDLVDHVLFDGLVDG